MSPKCPKRSEKYLQGMRAHSLKLTVTVLSFSRFKTVRVKDGNLEWHKSYLYVAKLNVVSSRNSARDPDLVSPRFVF